MDYFIWFIFVIIVYEVFRILEKKKIYIFILIFLVLCFDLGSFER